MESQDLRACLHAQLGVKVAERLVHQEDGRFADDRAPEGDTLALTAGELLRLAGKELGEVKDRRRLVDASVNLILRDLAQLEAEGKILLHRHVRVEGVALEDHRDVAILRRLVVHHHVTNLQRAASDVFKSGDHAQRGGLAAARRSYEDHELTVHNIE